MIDYQSLSTLKSWYDQPKYKEYHLILPTKNPKALTAGGVDPPADHRLEVALHVPGETQAHTQTWT